MTWYQKLAKLIIGQTLRWSYRGPEPPSPPFHHPMKARQNTYNNATPTISWYWGQHNKQWRRERNRESSENKVSSFVAALPDRGQQRHKNMHNKNAGDRTDRIKVKMFVCLLFLLFVMLFVACLLDCLLLMLMPWVEPVVVVLCCCC